MEQPYEPDDLRDPCDSPEWTRYQGDAWAEGAQLMRLLAANGGGT